jgi:hypothetical protein
VPEKLMMIEVLELKRNNFDKLRIHEMHDMVSAMYNYHFSERHFWHDE